MDETMMNIAESNRANGAGGMGARLLRELIRTPVFLEIIKSTLRDLDPDSARQLVRTLMWEDAELSLSLIGSVPQIINYMGAAGLELGKQMKNFPPALLDQYVPQVLGEINMDTFKAYPEVYGPLFDSMKVAEAVPVFMGMAVNMGTGLVINAAEKNPNFVGDALSQVNGRQVLKAGFAIIRSGLRWMVSGVKKLLKRGK